MPTWEERSQGHFWIDHKGGAPAVGLAHHVGHTIYDAFAAFFTLDSPKLGGRYGNDA